MEFPQLEASIRIRTGKGPARRLRRDGRAPAVVYGAGLEAISLSLAPKDLVGALSGPLHTNTVIKIHVAGGDKKTPKEITAMVRDHQYDPVSRELLHVDFVSVDIDKPITVRVPMEFTGRSVGEQIGGSLTVVHRKLPLECLPADIPELITHDITPLDLNDILTLAEVELPDNVTPLLPLDTTIALVQAMKAEEEEKPEDEDEEGVEGEEGAEGEGEDKEGEGKEGADDKAEGKSDDKGDDKKKKK